MSDKPVATLAAAVPPRTRLSTFPPDLVARSRYFRKNGEPI